MNRPVIVSGEASETESEDEGIQDPPYTISSSTIIKGAVITGEDSESENEDDGSICSAVSALNETTENKSKDNSDSLLHQKLRECNGKLQHDIESYCQSVVGEAGKNLNYIDQHLIKSQLTLQSAVTSLKSLSNSSMAIKSKLQSLLSAHFIPNIKVNKK